MKDKITTWSFYALDAEGAITFRSYRGEKQWDKQFPLPDFGDHQSKYMDAVTLGKEDKMSGIVLERYDEIPTKYLREVFDALVEALGVPFAERTYVFACTFQNGRAFPMFVVGVSVPHPDNPEKMKFKPMGYFSPQSTSTFTTWV